MAGRKAIPRLVREALEKKGYFRLSCEERVDAQKEFLGGMKSPSKPGELRRAYRLHRGRGYHEGDS